MVSWNITSIKWNWLHEIASLVNKVSYHKVYLNFAGVFETALLYRKWNQPRNEITKKPVNCDKQNCRDSSTLLQQCAESSVLFNFSNITWKMFEVITGKIGQSYKNGEIMTEVSDLGHCVGWTQLKGVHFNPIKCKSKYLQEKASGSLIKRGNPH